MSPDKVDSKREMCKTESILKVLKQRINVEVVTEVSWSYATY